MSTEFSILPSIQRHYSIEAIAREPWNQNSALYVPLESQHLIYGATSLASFIFLKSLNVSFKLNFVKNAAEMSPSGKSPLLRCGKYVIGEYEPISSFCGIKSLTIHKTNDDEFKAKVKSYLSLIESQFSDVMNFVLYNEKSNKKSLDNLYGGLYAWPLNKLIYYSDYYFIRGRMNSNNIWNIEKNQMINRFAEVLDALNRKLNSGSYLIDNRFTEADILLYSYIKIINNYNEFNEIKSSLRRFNNISEFYTNMNARFDEMIKTSYLGKFVY